MTLYIHKKTAELIIESGNHYVLQVKGNQKTLYQEVQKIILQKPTDTYVTHDKSRGRKSTWFIHVFDASRSPKAKEWKNLKTVIHVHKRVFRKGRETHQDRLYISDLPPKNAQRYHLGIRGHWKIENSLHWVKDVVHGEDKNGLKNHNAPVNASVFSSIAINIHRKFGQYSITESQIKFGANVKELFNFIRT